MPLGTEAGLVPDDIVLDGVPAPPVVLLTLLHVLDSYSQRKQSTEKSKIRLRNVI